MSSKRRKYTPEFKADAVQLVVVAQRPIAQVARELEINESSLGYWVKIYREQHPDPVKAPPPVEAARLAALEAEVRRLSEENAFLKKRPRPSGSRCPPATCGPPPSTGGPRHARPWSAQRPARRRHRPG